MQDIRFSKILNSGFRRLVRKNEEFPLVEV